MRSEWHIKFSALVKATKTVKASSVQVIKKLRGFRRSHSPRLDEFIEAAPTPVIAGFFVSHPNRKLEAALQLLVKIDQVWIDVVEDCAIRLQPERNGQSAAKWFDIQTRRMRLPEL